MKTSSEILKTKYMVYTSLFMEGVHLMLKIRTASTPSIVRQLQVDALIVLMSKWPPLIRPHACSLTPLRPTLKYSLRKVLSNTTRRSWTNCSTTGPSSTQIMGSVALPGSGHWERGSWERERGKRSWESYCYGNNVVSLQVNTAGIMAMNRMDRIVLDPVRTYACTRTARTGVRVTMRSHLSSIDEKFIT